MLQFPHLCLQTRQMTVKVKEVDLPGAVSGEPWRHDCQRHSGVNEEEKGGALRQHCDHGRCFPQCFQHGH